MLGVLIRRFQSWTFSFLRAAVYFWQPTTKNSSLDSTENESTTEWIACYAEENRTSMGEGKEIACFLVVSLAFRVSSQGSVRLARDSVSRGEELRIPDARDREIETWSARALRCARKSLALTDVGCNDPATVKLGHPRLFHDVVFAIVLQRRPRFPVTPAEHRSRRPRGQPTRFDFRAPFHDPLPRSCCSKSHSLPFACCV